jgi:hypothetical protein
MATEDRGEGIPSSLLFRRFSFGEAGALKARLMRSFSRRREGTSSVSRLARSTFPEGEGRLSAAFPAFFIIAAQAAKKICESDRHLLRGSILPIFHTPIV